VIFVTVGAQMAFDRLVRGVDEWAAARGRRDVFAQIGPTEWKPRQIEWTKFIDPAEFRRRVSEATVIVAHAGMGSIITALEAGVPILVMPRRGHLSETRNDHQVATAERFLALGRVAVAMDEHELPAKLDQLGSLTAAGRIGSTASASLLNAIRAFIGPHGEPAAAARRVND
jgi:UDP-N-acetylglucosamine transferase subunit ALG13